MLRVSSRSITCDFRAYFQFRFIASVKSQVQCEERAPWQSPVCCSCVSCSYRLEQTLCKQPFEEIWTSWDTAPRIPSIDAKFKFSSSRSVRSNSWKRLPRPWARGWVDLRAHLDATEKRTIPAPGGNWTPAIERPSQWVYWISYPGFSHVCVDRYSISEFLSVHPASVRKAPNPWISPRPLPSTSCQIHNSSSSSRDSMPYNTCY
jgi:hypothetical protein